MSSLKEAISVLSGLIERELEETLGEVDFTDLTAQQLRYLQVLVKMNNPTLSEFAREVGLTKPTVTVLVDKLMEKEYVKRVKSDEDRRSIHLHITKKGARINVLRETAYQRLAEKISAGLSKTETANFAELLKKMTG